MSRLRVFSLLAFAFAALVVAEGRADNSFRDAGSKIRGDYTRGGMVRRRFAPRYNYYTAPRSTAVATAPAAATPSPAAVAATPPSRTERTFSAEPQQAPATQVVPAAPRATYYVPSYSNNRRYMRGSGPLNLRNGFDHADRKIRGLGYYED